MPLRDILKKVHHSKDGDHAPVVAPLPEPAPVAEPPPHAPPEFTLIRSDTAGQEVIYPPSTPEDAQWPLPGPSSTEKPSSPLRRPSLQSHGSHSSHLSRSSHGSKREKRLSSLLHLRSSRARSASSGSVNLPPDLPAIDDSAAGGKTDEEREAQWEKRATMLAQGSVNLGSPLATEFGAQAQAQAQAHTLKMPPLKRQISDSKSDDDIQTAIKLHESGGADLTASTEMFGRLADPNGQNNALAQVLYGLALRHGWGIPADPNRAVTYLSAAATNCAAVEAAALDTGRTHGGAAKGELVLALYELANCLRHGWGCARDPTAARSYYETAANLGDVDALIEAARCYEEGVGGKKDKFTAAKYYRLAEEKGNKIVGNSWIWKDKYNPKA